MSFTQLTILLPCHSLEDFPLYHTGEDAAALLAAWTALWHPTLLAAANRLPTWGRCDDPPEDVAGRLFILPTTTGCELAKGYGQRVKEGGGVLLRKLTTRDELVNAALAAWREQQESKPELQAVLRVDDFYALGLCYLWTELLTRRMRYMSIVDEARFSELALEAAHASATNDAAQTAEQLQAAFNLLLQARHHFYPVDTFLLDMTLVVPNVAGAALRAELATGRPTTLVLSGKTLDEIAKHEPETLAAIRAALEAGTISVVGGDWGEAELPLLECETILAQLKAGGKSWEQHLGRLPEFYGRRRFGLTPMLPGILRGLGYRAAWHVTLDDGRFPEPTKSKTEWEGLGSHAIPAIAKVPFDANDPAAMLSLPEKLGETMDHDHVALLCFAHWPGQVSPFYESLRRATAIAPVVGKFATWREFFDESASSGEFSCFTADQYRSPYLWQDVVRKREKPTWSRKFEQGIIQLNIRNKIFAALTQLIAGRLDPGLLKKYRRLQPQHSADVRIDRHLSTHGHIPGDEVGEDWTPRELQELIRGSSHSLAELLGANVVDYFSVFEGLEIETDDEAFNQASLAAWRKLHSESGQHPGLLLLNPHGHRHRVGIEIPTYWECPPEVGGPVIAVEDRGFPARAVVEIPSCGFAWIGPGSVSSAALSKRAKTPPPIASERQLFNEFMQVTISEQTGAVVGVRDLKSRGNRLSQQLAFRLPPLPEANSWDDEPRYTTMVADKIEITYATHVLGEFTSKGRLVDDDGQVYAKFIQKTRLWTGSRVLELEISLEVIEQPKADPWNSYYACRWAWPDETMDIYRSVHETSQLTNAKKLEAPHFIEIGDEKIRTTLLTGGHAFHLRAGHRMLDTLLAVRGDTIIGSQLGIGIDVPCAAMAARQITDFGSAVDSVECVLAQPGNASGWLIYVDVRTVIVTAIEAVIRGERVVGARLRLLETVGLAGPVNVAAFREFTSARRVRFSGEPEEELEIKQGRAIVHLAGYDWAEIEAMWEEKE